MHCLRRAALRSALSATRAVLTPRAIAPFAAVAPADCSVARSASPQAIRFFSQTLRKASEDRQLEEAQRKSEEELDRQVVADARQDVEESVAQTEADIQEAMQEVTPEEPAPRRRSNESSQKSVFVRNLVFEITEEHLQKAFAKYGEVEGVFIARDPRGMSKGYGFVHFKTQEAVDDACANVNGSFWHGRRVTCIPRTQKKESPRSLRHRNSPSTPTAQLFIGNLPYETTDAELNRLFRSIDNITDVRVAVDRTTGWPRGFAHVDFKSVEAAMEAMKRLEGAKLGDRELKLDYAHGYRKGENQDKTSRSIFTDESE
ncbi:uncharacterized protein B0T15DRAFT_520768 [Chaetomium strumarium]|uniref:RRM domain-containing protein n=1 Tax=Chaetomium strumarium TaxID=1170767 RepID=A0AAJ0H3S7_9PEZI|nr:hypothetical protein B0T15DRAFT_520768 [Chaetomium strumarium]